MTVSAEKITPQGERQGTMALPEAIFAVEPKMHVMHQAVLRELANGRSGSANSKTRAEVRGGGKKPWKQKGTGRARAGSTRSPLWKGGGVIFGPKPRDFSMNMPKKVRRLAMKSALSLAVREQKLFVIPDFGFLSEPKTHLMNQFIEAMGMKEKKVLILANTSLEANKHLALAARNLPEVKLRLPLNLSVKDLILAETVLLTEDAVKEIEERFAHGTPA